MRIAVFGTGAVGGYFGGRLAQTGEDVVFIARGEHLRAMLIRHGRNLIQSLFCHLPGLWQAAPNPNRSMRNRAHATPYRNKQELHPQSNLDIWWDVCSNPCSHKHLLQPFNAVARTVVQLPKFHERLVPPWRI